MRPIRGTYYDGKKGGGVQVLIHVVADRDGDPRLDVAPAEADASDVLTSARWSECQLTPAVGETARYFHLPDGGSIESDDWRQIAVLEAGVGGPGFLGLVRRLEGAWPAVFGSLAVILVFGWGIYAWGIPWAAKRIAFALPASATEALSDETFPVLERLLDLDESNLSDDEQAALRAEFAEVVRFVGGEQRMRLHFRDGNGLANAFALPAGDIVVTDELVEAADDRREVVAVLAHEAGHVVERHSLRQAIESSGLFFVLGAVLGDIGSVSSLAGTLPVVLAEANYSQAHESEADVVAADYCIERGWEPTLLGDILSEIAGAGELPGEAFWSSHPTLAERVKYLEQRAAAAP